MTSSLLAPAPAAVISEDKKRFYWIDWLRFLAAAGVLAAHSRGGNWVEWASLAPGSRNKAVFAAFVLTRLGREFVVAFFVISGFLVGGGTIRRVMHGTFRPGPFALDRFVRIYVPLVPALLFGWIAAAVCGVHPSGRDFVGNLLGLQGVYLPVFAGIAPLWTLAYEIWFYVLAGAFATVIATMAATRQAVAFFIVATAFLVFVKLEAVYLFCWLVGALAYLRLGSSPSADGRWRSLLGVGVLTLIGVIGCELSSESNSFSREGLAAWLPGAAVSTLIMSTGFAGVVTLVSAWQPRSRWMVRLERAGSRFASFSYTLYLTHYPVLLLWDHYCPTRATTIDGTSLLRFAAKLASAGLTALAMYFLFERRTATIRQHLRRWLTI